MLSRFLVGVQGLGGLVHGDLAPYQPTLSDYGAKLILEKILYSDLVVGLFIIGMLLAGYHLGRYYSLVSVGRRMYPQIKILLLCLILIGLCSVLVATNWVVRQ